ncbi:MAG: helix-turn-helix transcriptional regulator [Alphaproteobacteria bacterium]|nr:helix-turn-helix transcriptional regulator [Alphaproteobacteria bacterium]
MTFINFINISTNIINMKVGNMNIIEKQRIKKNLNQEQLAEMVGLSQPSISLICNGNIKGLKFSVVKRLSEALDISVEEIFSDPEFIEQNITVR